MVGGVNFGVGGVPTLDKGRGSRIWVRENK
jgi:hypothetical protein